MELSPQPATQPATQAASAPGFEPATHPTSGPATQPSGEIRIDLGSGQASAAVNWILLATVLSVAPAVLILVTCFTRVVVVLGLLRSALATGQLPPNQVMFGLALLITVVVMAPVAEQVNRDALSPYLAGKLPQDKAIAAGEKHVRAFMIRQIESAGNNEDVRVFMSPEKAAAARSWDDVSTWSLIPGYVISELKVAFWIGFKIFLPFLVIDMLVSSVLVSMGMLMVPPMLISLPFKLLLFVLADGWRLVVGTLITSFG